MPKVKPSAEQVRSLLDYEPETGIFRWRFPAGRGGRFPAGSVAGGVNSEGYRYILILGTHYPAGPLAWLWMVGEWPDHQVDHQDVDPGNNRWSNLRLATSTQNTRNRKLSKNNTSGFKGVHWQPDRQCWRAKVYLDGKPKWLRRWPTAEEAYAEWCAVTATEYGEFARHERRQP